MFCSRCGALVTEGAKFCNKCGAPIRGACQVAVGGAQPEGDGEKPKKGVSRRVIGIGVVIVAVLIVAVVVLNTCGSSGGARSAEALGERLEKSVVNIYDSGMTDESIENYVNVIFDNVPEGMEEALYELSEDELGESIENRDELTEYMIDDLGLGTLFDLLKDYLDSLDYTIEIVEGDELDSDELRDIEDDLADYYDLQYEVDDGVELEVVCAITATEDIDDLGLDAGESYEDTVIALDAIEIDGRWYLWLG